MVAHRRALEPLPGASFQSIFLHQPNHALATEAFVLLEQIFVNPWTAVAVLTGFKRRPDEHAELPIALRVRRFRPPPPGIVATRRHVERPTQLADLEGGLLRGDPRKLHCWCFAKKAAAFFRISRSVRSSRTSLRRRPSSSRSAVVSTPGLPLPRSARARSTHLRSDDSVKSRSRAVAPTLLPSSSTSRTACALNSSSNRRRGRRLFVVSAIGLDIVSAFRKMSTKADQTHMATPVRWTDRHLRSRRLLRITLVRLGAQLDVMRRLRAHRDQHAAEVHAIELRA